MKLGGGSKVLWFTAKSAAVCTVGIVGGLGASLVATLGWNLVAKVFHFQAMTVDGTIAVTVSVAIGSIIATLFYAMVETM